MLGLEEGGNRIFSGNMPRRCFGKGKEPEGCHIVGIVGGGARCCDVCERESAVNEARECKTMVGNARKLLHRFNAESS